MDEKILRVVERGTQAEIASRFFKEFIDDRISQLLGKMDNLVRTSVYDGTQYIALAHTLNEYRELSKTLDRAIAKSRMADAKQTNER